MKLIIDGTPEEIKKMLNTICGSEEQGENVGKIQIDTNDFATKIQDGLKHIRKQLN